MRQGKSEIAKHCHHVVVLWHILTKISGMGKLKNGLSWNDKYKTPQAVEKIRVIGG